MIIWGSKVREIRGQPGSFFCPSCLAEASFQPIALKRYFTLYFIPLFPTETLQDYVQCRSCRGEFRSSVLRLGRDEILAAVSPWRCDCGNANPASDRSCLACAAPRAVAA